MYTRFPIFFTKHFLFYCTVIPMIIAMVLGSRSFTIGYLAATAFVYLAYKKFSVSKRTVVMIVTFFVAALVSLTWFVKHDSSLGRWLIYKVSMNIWEQNSYKGIGYNQFEKTYNLYQEAYFKTGNYSQKELLLADDTYYAFNDYFQFTLELGVAGIFLLLFAVTLFIWLVALNYTSPKSDLLKTTIVVSQMIAICTAAVFTHVFEKPLFQYVILLGVIYLLVNCQRWTVLQKKIVFLTAVVVVAAFGVARYKQLKETPGLNDWVLAQQLYNAGEVTDALDLYRKCSLTLDSDPAFLTSYGVALQKSGRYHDALRVFCQAFELLPSSKRLVYMAECFSEFGDSAQAEACYRRAINMVPNRFNPRYYLFNLYVSTGCRNQAQSVGEEILSLPVKIPSPRIDFIKDDVLNRMEQISSL